MNQHLYYSLIAVLYILSIFSLFLIPYSIIKLKRRSCKYVYLSKFFVFFGYFCIAVFYVIFIDAIHIDGINYQANNIEFLMIMMIVSSLLGVIQLWIWTHYEIHIQEDRFIYCHSFYGKSVIEFNQIDINNSVYLFVHPKGKRDLAYEVLKLKMKNGKEYSLLLDDLLQGGNSSLMIDTIIFKLKIKREAIYK